MSDKKATVVSLQSQLLSNNGDISKLRNNDLLQKDEWKELDDTVVKVAKGALNGISDLVAAGCTHSLGDIGTIVSQYETMSDMEAAEVNLSGVTETQGDTPEYGIRSILVPMIFKDSFLNIRRLMASRRNGEALDTSVVAISTRLCVEAMENLLFNGSSMKSGDASIYGYFSHPHVTDVGAPSGAWSTPANIFTDVENCLGQLDLSFGIGKYTIYLAPALMKHLRADSKASSSLTVRDRLLAYPEIDAIKSSTAVPAGHMLVAQLTPDVVDWAVAQDIKPLQWTSGNEMQLNVRVMACATPRIKSDDNEVTPIVKMDGIVSA